MIPFPHVLITNLKANNIVYMLTYKVDEVKILF